MDLERIFAMLSILCKVVFVQKYEIDTSCLTKMVNL